MTLDEAKVRHPQHRMISHPQRSVPRLRRSGMNCAGLPCRLCPWDMPWRASGSLPAQGQLYRNTGSLAGRTFLDVTPIPVLFSERPQVVISAGLSQAWRLLGGQTPPRLDAAALRAWSQPGWIKAAMEFRLEPIPAGTLLSTETRILATDPRSRRSFAAYWFLIRASSAAIRREVLRVVARRAESHARQDAQR